jgi:hypothetical protein
MSLTEFLPSERPYKCNFCERSYAQSNDLLKHTRIHVGEVSDRHFYPPPSHPLILPLTEHLQMQSLHASLPTPGPAEGTLPNTLRRESAATDGRRAETSDG